MNRQTDHNGINRFYLSSRDREYIAKNIREINKQCSEPQNSHYSVRRTTPLSDLAALLLSIGVIMLIILMLKHGDSVSNVLSSLFMEFFEQLGRFQNLLNE